MAKVVPSVDAQRTEQGPTTPNRREELELELLDAEAKLRNLANREIGQRYAIKWIAVVATIVAIIGMGLLLWHVSHYLFSPSGLQTHPSVAVAILVAPIVSITTITITLFIGAFRRFESNDLDIVGQTVNGAALAARNVNS